MWYTQEEKPLRFGLWTVTNGAMPVPFLGYWRLVEPDFTEDVVSLDSDWEPFDIDSMRKAFAAMYMGCDVKGLPMKHFGSINSAKARMSANLVERIVGVRVGWAALGKRGWGRSR